MHFYLLTFGAVCGIIMVSRGEVKQPRSHQERKSGDEVGTLEKKCKKPLDKPHRMCYNECIKRQGQQKPSLATVEQKSLKKPLDKQHKMCYNEYIKRGTQRDTP